MTFFLAGLSLDVASPRVHQTQKCHARFFLVETYAPLNHRQFNKVNFYIKISSVMTKKNEGKIKSLEQNSS